MKKSLILLLKKFFAISLIVLCFLSAFGCDKSQSSANETNPKFFEYEEIDGGLKITKYVGESDVVVVPSIIDNKKVIALDKSVFSGNVTLKEVTLAESFTSFSISTFENCESLQKIVHCGNVTNFATVFPDIISSLPSLQTLEFYKIEEEPFRYDFPSLIENSGTLKNIVVHDITDSDRVSFVRESSDFYTNDNKELNITVSEKIVNNFSQEKPYLCTRPLSDDYIDEWYYLMEDSEFFDVGGKEEEVSEGFKNAFISQFSDVYGGKVIECRFYTLPDSSSDDLFIIGKYQLEDKTYYFENSINYSYIDWAPDDIDFFVESAAIYTPLEDSAKMCILFGCDKIRVNSVLCELK